MEYKAAFIALCRVHGVFCQLIVAEEWLWNRVRVVVAQTTRTRSRRNAKNIRQREVHVMMLKGPCIRLLCFNDISRILRGH